MARKPRVKRKEAPVQEEFDGFVQPDDADGQVSGAAVGREEVEVHEQTEEQALAEALINLGHNEVYEDALRRVSKLTKQERVMLLERVRKPPN